MKSFFEAISKLVGFKLMPRFYVLLLIGIIIGSCVDYCINNDRDFRLSICYFGLSILMTFTIYNGVQCIKTRRTIRKTVRNLSLDDCIYVSKCYHQNEYFYFRIDGSYIEFETKWKSVLYVPRGKMIAFHEPYKIYVNEYAYKLVKKRLHKAGI